MNFKDWKKVSEDGKTCMLRHPKGHTMSIALKALPKIHQEQIKRLAFDDGGLVDTVQKALSPDFYAAEKAKQQSQQLPPPAYPPDIKHYDEGTPPGGVSADDSADQSVPPAPSVVGAPVTDPSAPVPGSDISVRADGRATAPIAQEAKAIEEQQAIDTAKAKQNALNETAYLHQRQNLAQQDADNVGELKKHTDEYADYIKQNPINAHQFQDNLGTGQKITAGLGLFLGGLGTPFGGQNVALDMLNKQIDRNIDAQKQNAEQQKNVWGAYEHLYGDQNIATNLAKVSANDILSHQANLLAAQLGTPQSRQNADQLMAAKNKENATLFGMTAQRLTGLKNGTIAPNPGPSGMARIKAMQGPKTSQSGFEGTYGNAGPGAKEAGFMPPMSGASNDSGAQAPTEQILGPNAAGIAANLRYDHTHTPEQIAKATEQYGQAQKTDRILKQIDQIFPEIQSKATYGGLAAKHIDPHSVAAAAGAVGLGTGMLMGGPAGAVAGAPIGAGIGEAVGHLGQGAARLMGGQQETEYLTDKAALVGYIGNALAGTKVTPSEIENLVEEFVPTKADDAKSAANKLSKLKEKIVTLANTDALDLMGMTNKKGK